MPSINWDDMESAHEEASRPAPAGRYVIQVKKFDEGESKKGAHPQIRIIWEIAEGPYKGKGIFDYLTFNKEKPVSISMARATIQLLGFKDLRQFGEIDQKQRAEMALGRRIEADLEVSEYEGRLSNKIKNKIRGITGGGTGSAPDGVSAPPPKKDDGDLPAPAKPKNPLAGI